MENSLWYQLKQKPISTEHDVASLSDEDAEVWRESLLDEVKPRDMMIKKISRKAPVFEISFAPPLTKAEKIEHDLKLKSL